MWKGVNLDHLRSAVQNAQQLVKEGVQEFSAELREGVHQVASTDPDRNDDWTGEAAATTGPPVSSSAMHEDALTTSASKPSPNKARMLSPKPVARQSSASRSRGDLSNLTDSGKSPRPSMSGKSEFKPSQAGLVQTASRQSLGASSGNADGAAGPQRQPSTSTPSLGKPPAGAHPSSKPGPSTSGNSPPGYAFNTRTSSKHGDSSGASVPSPQRKASEELDSGSPVSTAPAAQLNSTPTSSAAPTTLSAMHMRLPSMSLEGLEAGAGSEVDMHRAHSEMQRAYNDMKLLLKKSMDECVRLSDEVVRLEGQARASQIQAQEAGAALKEAKKESLEATTSLAAARKDADKAQKAMEKVQAKLKEMEAKHAEEAGTAELEGLRSELMGAVRKAQSAVEAREAAEARAAKAEAARVEAENARNEADRLRREAQSEAHAALAAAEAERSTRAEAEDQTETLRQEQERRARVFNNAVKAAVGRVQRELEGERDELQGQLRDAHKELTALRTQLRLTQAAVEDAQIEAAARTQDAVAAGNLADVAEQTAQRAAAREAAASMAAHAAEAGRQEALREAKELREQCEALEHAAASSETEVQRLQEQLAAETEALETKVSELERDVLRQQERAQTAARALQAAEKQLHDATAASSEAAEKAAAEAAGALKRVSELEAELHTLRTSSSVMSLFTLPTKQDVLAGLGLEVVKDDRLRWKSEGDVEAVAVAVPRAKGKGPGAGGMGGGAQAAAAKVLGVIPVRVWLFAGYLFLLHIFVMVSFTRSHDIEKLCGPAPAAQAHGDLILP